MNFEIERCGEILQLIENKEVADAAKGYPSIVNASFCYTTLMVATLSGAWAAAVIETYKIDIIYSILASQVVITPYIYGTKKCKKIAYKNL